LIPEGKNPTKVRAGQLGARKRWGETRIVRLADLTEPQRRLVVALVDAARNENKVAAAEGQSFAAADRSEHGDVRPAA
jgi:hypothetical protein